MNQRVIFLLLGLTAFAVLGRGGWADNLDSHDQTALLQTQQFLKDSKARNKYIEKHPEAKQANDQLNQLTGGVATDQVYSLAASIFSMITKDSHGDPKAMQKMLSDYAKNPQAFIEKLSPEQQAQLRDIASKVSRMKQAP